MGERTARLLPLQGTVDASRGKVGMRSGVTDCSVSTEARACPELIFTGPHWDSQQKQGGERGKHRGVAEYSKKLSGANKDPEARTGVFHHLPLSRLRSTVLQCVK